MSKKQKQIRFASHCLERFFFLHCIPDFLCFFYPPRQSIAFGWVFFWGGGKVTQKVVQTNTPLEERSYKKNFKTLKILYLRKGYFGIAVCQREYRTETFQRRIRDPHPKIIHPWKFQPIAARVWQFKGGGSQRTSPVLACSHIKL